MAPWILTAIYIILIICFAWVGVWLVDKIGLPAPAGMIARGIVVVIALLLLISLFVPGMGIAFPR